jgi:nucleoside-diphosphate-sugar epimerase
MSRILVTGGAGYLGARLIPDLVLNHDVIVYDTCWFYKPDERRNLTIVKADIRNIDAMAAALVGVDTVIHLACISNDASFMLNPAFSTEINYFAFLNLLRSSRKLGVKRFILASSSSVYGISDLTDVTESAPCAPLTRYSSLKLMCEEALWEYQREDFACVAVRPATLCGYSPRMRFDLMVNSMLNQAVRTSTIKVSGGDQYRANLHIDDMCSVYKLLIEAPVEKIAGHIFNVGHENLTVRQIAQLVAGHVAATIEFAPSADQRSYRINSDKLYDVLGFRASRLTERAISEMCERFLCGEWKDSLINPVYMNVDQYRATDVA